MKFSILVQGVEEEDIQGGEVRRVTVGRHDILENVVQGGPRHSQVPT